MFCFYYCFNCFICSVNKHYFLLNPRASLLQYVILTAFPLQQLLHECASLLRYTYIAGLVSPCVRWSLRFLGVWKRFRKFSPDIKYIFMQLWNQIMAAGPYNSFSSAFERSKFLAQHRDADGGEEYPSFIPPPPLHTYLHKQTLSKRYFLWFECSCGCPSFLLVLL